MVSYITYAQLAEDVKVLIRKLPRSLILDLAGIVGIPRSGMLPATMIANHLHLPLMDCYSFVRCGYQFTISGNRVVTVPQGRTVLVVDDTIYAGSTMLRAMSVLTENPPSGLKYEYAAVYRCPEKAIPIGYYARDVAKPRYFEWNLMQHPDMPTFMLDMDGVICYDPPPGMSESEYNGNFALVLKDADPLHLPAYPAHSICTMRLERYRALTENWLVQHKVQYGDLLMVDLPTAIDRKKQLDYGKCKGQKYLDSTAALFIESDSSQAISIAYHSSKPVICLSNHAIYQKNHDGYIGAELKLVGAS